MIMNEKMMNEILDSVDEWAIDNFSVISYDYRRGIIVLASLALAANLAEDKERIKAIDAKALPLMEKLAMTADIKMVEEDIKRTITRICEDLVGKV